MDEIELVGDRIITYGYSFEDDKSDDEVLVDSNLHVILNFKYAYHQCHLKFYLY